MKLDHITQTIREWQQREWALADEMVEATLLAIAHCEHAGLALPQSVAIHDETLDVYDPALPKNKFPAGIILNYSDQEFRTGRQRVVVSTYPPSVRLERYEPGLLGAKWKAEHAIEDDALFHESGAMLTTSLVQLISWII